jgi:hypothetical protein
MTVRRGRRSIVALALVLSTGVLAQVLGTGVASAATATADYRFLRSRATSAGTAAALTDVKSSICGTNNPANKFTTAKVGGRKVPVLAFPKDNGLRLKTGVVGPSYTIVMLFELSTEGAWRRLIDFSDSTSDTGLYAGPSNDLYFFPDASGADTFAAGDWVQVVLTRDSGSSNLIGYLNGKQEFTYVDTRGDGLPGANPTIFFHDNTTGGAVCESSAGDVARIEVYDSALSPSEVKALPLLPGKQTISLSKSSVAAGSSVTVTGSNYGPAEVVTISFKDSAGTTSSLGTVTTAEDGSFSTSVTIPSTAAAGAGTVSAKGGTSRLSASKALTVT